MKKVKLAVLVVVIAVVGWSVSERSAWACGQYRCDSANDVTLCDNGVDVGCDDWCKASARCDYYGFTDVCGSCDLSGVSNWCTCRGTL